MNARPILFSTAMIRGLAREINAPGTGKTQTRRVVKPQPERGGWNEGHFEKGAYWLKWPTVCPYGRYGDLLWVREAFYLEERAIDHGASITRYKVPVYKADSRMRPEFDPIRYKPSIHMPRQYSRVTLRITDIRIQRLQEITDIEAIKEGVLGLGDEWLDQQFPGYFEQVAMATAKDEKPPLGPSPRERFAKLIDSLNKQRGFTWATNPWMWALTFDVIHANVDQVLKEAA